MVFKDRRYAGFLLTKKLNSYQNTDTLVLGLPRGGIVTASEIARNLHLLLDVLVVKKIPSPGNPELAIGALAPDDISVIDWKLAQRVGASKEYTRTQISELNDQIKQKILLYRKNRRPLLVNGKVIIVVDDGAATGATVEASVKWLKKNHAKKIIIALPVAPSEVARTLESEVDECAILETPTDFSAVGQFYERFEQVEDKAVIRLLKSDK